MKNKKCLICEKEFHACGSCSINTNWEYKYCSEGCWHKSEDYIKTKLIFTKIYNKLKNDSLHGDFIEIFCIEDDDYEFIINDWIEEIECKEGK